MKPFRPLTALAQEAVGRFLVAGSLAIDATAGNGHDTLFLAQRVGPNGRVVAFDIQATALYKTRARLDEAGLQARLTCHHCNHDRLLEQLPGDWAGRVSAVMFNLGYLPGADKTVVTQAGSTVRALDQALTALRPGGLLSLLLYRGHAGAQEETDAVEAWSEALSPEHRRQVQESPGPVLYLIEKASPE